MLLKDGQEKLKTSFSIYDESGMTVDLVMWGDHWPGYCHLLPDRIVALRGVVVGEFRGKNLSSSWGVTIDIDTPIILPRYKTLLEYCQNVKIETLKPINSGPFSKKFVRDRRKIWSIAEIRSDSSQTFDELTDDEKTITPLFYNTVANIGYIQSEKMYYNACPDIKCMKKVYLHGERWRCDNCMTSYGTCVPRLIMYINIKDHTGDLWVMPSNQVITEKMIGKNGNEVKN